MQELKQQDIVNIIKEVKKVIVGKDEIICKVLLVFIAGGHVLLEDVPGVGKTTMALGFSKALSFDYKRLQFTPDTMASDIVGFSVYDKETDKLQYKPGVAMCNLLLADEINRTSARTQAALLEVMEEQGMTVDGVTHKSPNPFICIATQNPVGSAGTQKLPDSQLDRFMVKLSIGFPDVNSQLLMVKERQKEDPINTINPVLSVEEFLTLRTAVKTIHVEDDIIQYAAELSLGTSFSDDVELGVSPRATLALIDLAKAHAFAYGRSYVIPNDISKLFTDVCAHRLILSPHARIQKIRKQDILAEVLERIAIPTIV